MECYMVRYEDITPLPLEKRADFANNAARILLGRGGLPAPGCLFRTTFFPSGFHAEHVHTMCDEYVYVISGHGLKGVAGQIYKLEPGCAYYLPKGFSHWMKNTDPTQNIEVVGFYPGVSHFDDTGYQFVGPIPGDVIANDSSTGTKLSL